MTKVVLKWSKGLALMLVAIVLTMMLATSLLLFTHSGFGALLWAVEKAVPQLHIDSYQGSLFPRFTLNNVRFSDPKLGIDSEFRSMTLAVNPLCFTEPSICVDELSIDGMKLSMAEITPSSESSANSTHQGKITTPIPIRVSRLALSDIDANVLGNKLNWQSLTTGFVFQGNHLLLNKTNLQQTTLALVDVKEQKTSSPTTAKQTDNIELPEIELPLQIEVLGVDVNDFRLLQEKPFVINHLGLKANASGAQVAISNLTLDTPELAAQLTSQVTLKRDYPLNLRLQATVKQESAKGQKLSLSAQGSVGELSLDASLSGLAQANLQAKLKLLEPDLPFDIAIEKGKLQWPLHGKGNYFININSLQSQGSLKSYSLELSTAMKGKDLPNVDVELQGEGSHDQINLSSMTLNTLGGSVSGDVKVNWQQPLNWDANLSLSHIQPGLQWVEAEGDLSGTLSTYGSLTDEGGWQAELSKLNIDGVLRQYPLNIEGTLSASDPKGKGEFTLETPRLVLSHGPNRIRAEGRLNGDWQMDLSIQLTDLAASIPDLAGRALGDVQLRGPVKQPNISLMLDVNAIDWQQQTQIKHVALKGNVTPLPTPSGDLTLQVEDANYQDYQVKDAELAFRGTQKAHQLTLDVVSNLVSTSLALSGSLTDKPAISWSGALQRMTISSKQGEWQLAQSTPLGFAMATEQVSVAAHCWLQEDSSICLNQDIEVGKSGEASIAIKQFDFEQIKALLPTKTAIVGLVNGELWAKWSEGNSPQVKASISLPKGGVTQQLDTPLKVGWEAVTFNATLKQDRLAADWLVDVSDNGDISGQAIIPNVTVKDKQIEGQLNISTFNVDFLAPLLGQYSQLKSNITTDIALSGPLLQPKVQGQLLVEDIALNGEISPIQIDSGQLKIDFTGYRAALESDLNTPDGILKLTGDASWQDLNDWSSRLRVFATELNINVPPMVEMKVVPDMTISASPKYARIDGDIALPWGNIVVKELPPSAIGVSKDQVILNEHLQPDENGAPLPFEIETNINISIGDEFKVSAFGLEGGLVGQLNVAQRDKGPFVTGEINIVDGSYKSFGQDLVIDQGKILMNGPVDQPYVQISAIRNPDNTQDDVTAGVKVTGPATEPAVTIFSEPVMPQANALSYLLRGQNIDGEAGGNAMTTTLIGLSLAKSGRVVGEIGQAFGVQDLQLDTAGSGEESQVTVSGYVLPGLQVKYGVGIFDSVGEFTVRYRLMKDLYVEGVTGVGSAVDLLYQFEFN